MRTGRNLAIGTIGLSNRLIFHRVWTISHLHPCLLMQSCEDKCRNSAPRQIFILFIRLSPLEMGQQSDNRRGWLQVLREALIREKPQRHIKHASISN